MTVFLFVIAVISAIAAIILLGSSMERSGTWHMASLGLNCLATTALFILFAVLHIIYVDYKPTQRGEQLAVVEVVKTSNGCFRSDQLRFVFCNTDKSVGLWDFSTGKLVKLPLEEKDIRYLTRAYSLQLERRTYDNWKAGKPTTDVPVAVVKPAPKPVAEPVEKPVETPVEVKTDESTGNSKPAE